VVAGLLHVYKSDDESLDLSLDSSWDEREAVARENADLSFSKRSSMVIQVLMQFISHQN
jgi:hypothetical protein